MASAPKPEPKVREEYGDIVVLSNENNYASRPVERFEDIDLPQGFFSLFKQYGYVKPTKIQSIAIPIALESYDIIGIAKTGSGKTLSFVLPILMAIEDEKRYWQEEKKQPYNNSGKPRAVVLAPTRELALQIFDHTAAYAKCVNQNVVCVYGGADSRQQRSELANGVDLLIGTPGRLHDFVQRGSIDLSEAFILVLDEADRMLDMGFLPQVRAIVDHLKESRQTLLWSATWPAEVDALSRHLCKNKPVTIRVGDEGLTINTAIKQHVLFVQDNGKRTALLAILRSELPRSGDKAIIFSSTKKNCELLVGALEKEGLAALSIHGDKDQRQRESIMQSFKTSVDVLVATDVAARGLDIKNVKVVVNYDFPNSIEDYVHRIGRTGRAGQTGQSFTFFTGRDSAHGRALADLLRKAGQEVPQELMSMERSERRAQYGRWDEGEVSWGKPREDHQF